MNEPTMREVQMILDCVHEEGGAATLRNGQSYIWAGDKICSVFGGYTADQVVGCWVRDGRPIMDTGMRYTVGLVLGPLGTVDTVDWDAFCKLATILAAGQETVWVKGPDGVAEVLVVPQEEGEVDPSTDPRFTRDILSGWLGRRTGAPG